MFCRYTSIPESIEQFVSNGWELGNKLQICFTQTPSVLFILELIIRCVSDEILTGVTAVGLFYLVK